MSVLLEPTVLEVRLLNTGDGLGEKLPLIKSHILPAPPFRPVVKHYSFSSLKYYLILLFDLLNTDICEMAFPIPKEFCVDVGVPRRPCSVFTGGTCGWLCWEAIPVSRDWDREWDIEPSGEAEREEDECREEDRAREPGILTGAEPPNNL